MCGWIELREQQQLHVSFSCETLWYTRYPVPTRHCVFGTGFGKVCCERSLRQTAITLAELANFVEQSDFC